jgi:penicillin-insensitive murein endopeptidase
MGSRLLPTIVRVLQTGMLRTPTAILVFGLATFSAVAAERPAKELFGAEPLPAALASEPIGFYSRGCMAGAVQLPPDGPYWQAMRLSRNRQWGLPILVDFVEKLAEDAATKDGWPGLLVGDMSQPRGGPMLTGHASHQVGLDADIWLNPMPSRRYSEQEREDISAVAMTEPGPHFVYENRWTPRHGLLIRRAALDPRVERIFVAPGIKKKLCETAGTDRRWLSKVRPYYGHNYHFHVRLSCPPGARCKAQAAPPPGDGCGADLDYWFSAEPYKPAPKPEKPVKPKEIMLSELPPACRTVLRADPIPGTVTMREAFALKIGLGGSLPADSGMSYVQAGEPTGAIEEVETARLPRPRPEGY